VTPDFDLIPIDDPAFIAALKGGSDAAAERLVRESAPRMLAVARRMLGDADAHDALQDAYFSAFKAMNRFDAASKLTTWLHRIVVNACLMRLRRKAARPESSIDALLPRFRSDGHFEQSITPWKPHASTGIEADETRHAVRECVALLPDDYRTVLILRDIEELDTEETATMLGISTNAVKTRLHRARLALRELIDQRVDLFASGGDSRRRSDSEPGLSRHGGGDH